MRSFRIILICLSVLLFCGCAHDRTGALSNPTGELEKYIGQRVTLVGVVELRKGDVAAIRGDDFYVWIDMPEDWLREYVGNKVQVLGILEERHDLPVLIQKPGELPQQGISVPEGTDLYKASRRYVLRDVKWRLLE